MTRYPDWQERLDRFLKSSAHAPFSYGSNDCCLFVANSILAMTGTDLAADFRGQYASQKEALALAKSFTGRSSVRALVEQSLAALPSIPVSCAQRGDIVLVKRGRDSSLGLVSLNGRDVLAMAAAGFLRYPLDVAARAWRV